MEYKEQIHIYKGLSEYVKLNLDFMVGCLQDENKTRITHVDVVNNINALTETLDITTEWFEDNNWNGCTREFTAMNDMLTGICFVVYSKKYREQLLSETNFLAENTVWWFTRMIGHLQTFGEHHYFYFEEDEELAEYFRKCTDLCTVIANGEEHGYSIKEQADMIFRFIHRNDREFVKTVILQMTMECITLGLVMSIYKDKSLKKGEPDA